MLFYVCTFGLFSLTHLGVFLLLLLQTDPNWGNFLYDETKKSINLIDFGAARDYPKGFVDNYLKMVCPPDLC